MGWIPGRMPPILADASLELLALDLLMDIAQGYYSHDFSSNGGPSKKTSIPKKKVAVVPTTSTPPKICNCPPPSLSFASKDSLSPLLEIVEFIENGLKDSVYSKDLESRLYSAIDTYFSYFDGNIQDMDVVTSYNFGSLVDEMYSLFPLSSDSSFFSKTGTLIPDCSALKMIDFFTAEVVDTFCFKFLTGDRVFFDSLYIWDVVTSFFSYVSENTFVPVYLLKRSSNGLLSYTVVPQSLLTLHLEA